MPISIGIDLGTTYSAAAYVNPSTGRPEIIPNPDGRHITPSVILFEEGRPIFGSEAEEAFRLGLGGCAATFKRSMGKNETYCAIDGKDYTAEELSSMLLRYIKEYAEAGTGQEIADAVITVPAYFYSVEREATLNAAQEAGLIVRKIIDEPNAAAISYGLNHWRENANILVYDLGGGTFDVTLTHMQKDGELQAIAVAGDHFLGGRDWDERLSELIADKVSAETDKDIKSDFRAMRTIRGLSEGVKKSLSQLMSVNAVVSLPVLGNITVQVTRAEFASATADLLKRTGDFCLSVLDKAQVSVNDVADVLLVGGSTRMPAVSEHLAGIFGKKPIAHVNPDEAVALGAAVQAVKENPVYSRVSFVVKDGRKVTERAQFTGLVKPERRLSGLEVISVRETTAHAMGMIAVSPDGTRYINDIIIPADHPRPVKAAKAFSFRTTSKKAADMEIYVLQGDKEAPLENKVTFRYVVTGIQHNPSTRGKTTIRVQYTYDNNGIIHVEARQDSSSVNLPIRREPVPEDMSKFSSPVERTEDPEPETLNLVMAVDVSGSMSGEPLQDAQDAMCDFVDKLDLEYTRVGIMAVSDRTKIVCRLTDDKRQCLRAIKSIKCGQTGYGNSAHPFGEIMDVLEDEEGRRFAIVLADGVWSDQSRAVKAARQCNRAGIDTAGIGFGEADIDFLRDISSDDANAVFVEGSGELGHAFGTIAQSLGESASVKGGISGTEDADTWED
ncbi:MAG: Hsp70 family protein [Synergistaceae bacterium]|nr:Hsp70 family protein [Synergistaceae bacterium]